MDSIVTWLQSGLSFIIPMTVLLGLLIFVHELGHFLVAKYNKVRVEVFSLGFGPKILKYKRGDTVYAISAIPLGGYVKMFGDDPTSEVTKEQREYSLTHKRVGQRIAIVLAGPLMNFFFAIVLFAGVAFIGEPALAPQLGDIETSSPAHSAGFRSGDKILSANGNTVRVWDDFNNAIEGNADNKVTIELERASGQREALEITPKLVDNKNVLSWSRKVGEIEGLSTSSKASVVGVSDPKSIAARAGLRTGDLIQKIEGTEIGMWRNLVTALETNSSKETIQIEVERGILEQQSEGELETVKVTLPVPAAARGKGAGKVLASVGVEFPELFLATVEQGTPAYDAGLKRGDKILSINGQNLNTFDEVAGIIRSFGQSAPKEVQGEVAATTKTTEGKANPLAMVVSRAGEKVAVNVAPNMKSRMTNQGREETRFEIGIRPMILEARPATVDLRYTNPVDAVSRGVSQTMKWTSLTVLSFVRLFQAEVSPKNIGGFLSIGQMAKRSFQIGISQFMNVMAIISINLFILNLLPVPVLDGGHLVFYTIEALRGAPLSMRKMEIAQQVGLVLLLGLMVFALFNDFSRLLS